MDSFPTYAEATALLVAVASLLTALTALVIQVTRGVQMLDQVRGHVDQWMQDQNGKGDQ